MSSGLLRARQEYRVPNALTGLTLALFIGAVWAYSIRAVKQENFDDIDQEARQMALRHSPSASAKATVDREMTAVSQPSGLYIEATHADAPRGLLPRLLPPRHLDPVHRTLVWGAPPIDHLGSVRDTQATT